MERKKYITKTGEEFSYLASDIKKGSRNFVFFHATGFNAETYKILFNKIKIHFDNEINIYAIDQRGHGMTNAKSEPDNLKSWDIFVDDGKEFIESLEKNFNIKTIGLGDSPNDLPLLLNSDYKIVIPSPNGPNLKLLEQLEDFEYTLASEPNGYGWQNEINKLINKLKLIKQ